MKGNLKKLVSGGFLLAGALIVGLEISALAQNTSQIGPGNTGSISPAQGVSGGANDPSGKKLNSALTPETRQTLQEAMDSVDPATLVDSGSSREVTLGPGEGAEIDGTGINRVAFDRLPGLLKNAMSNGTLNNLNGNLGR